MSGQTSAGSGSGRAKVIVAAGARTAGSRPRERDAVRREGLDDLLEEFTRLAPPDPSDGAQPIRAMTTMAARL